MAAITFGVSVQAVDNSNILVLSMKDGSASIKLRPDLARAHVEQIKKLVRDGAYDNVVFHRVIDGFMAQTGDVQYGNMKSGYNADYAGIGKSKYPDIPAEFSSEPFKRRTVGMARSLNPNSANSQFFICFEDAPWLDRQYTVWGQIADGIYGQC